MISNLKPKVANLIKLISIDVDKICNELQSLYSQVITEKNQLIDKYNDKFEQEYMISAKSFAREMLLDPSECENAFFILPQLTRDSFSKKGLFYKTDKILIQNYSASFSQPSATRVKESLQDAFALLDSIASSA